MLIRRLLLFFFFELSLLDSITVLPIFFCFFFCSSNRKKKEKETGEKGACSLANCCMAIADHQQPPPPSPQLPSLLTTTTLRRCLIHQEVGSAVKRGRARIFKWACAPTVYRCYVADRVPAKCVSPAVCSSSLTPERKKKTKTASLLRVLDRTVQQSDCCFFTNENINSTTS